MGSVRFDKTISALYGVPFGDTDFWIDRRQIPLGTLLPYENYDGEIPLSDIVTIDFDDIDTPPTSRNAMNILILAGSGDGKSMMLKLIWSVLHRAGYYCGYIDPKSTDSGRARRPWQSKRIPIKTKAEGIELQHFMPVWAQTNFEHMQHNFRKYSTRLSKINEREMWMGLGMTSIGASKTAKIITQYIRDGEKISMAKLKQELFNLDIKELPQGSADAVFRVLNDLEDYDVVNDETPELKLLQNWKKGYSICISYNSAAKILMSFDIGQKIKESARLYFQGNRRPIMWFLDDSSFYAKEERNLIKHNFAVQEIKEIGFNYRSLGVYNTMAVQSLGIIDENVAESYRVKIISPLFQSIEGLSAINIPKKAIEYLKEGVLVKDKKAYLMQYMLITEDNEVVPFFPFTPPCGHFTEVYFPIEVEREV